MTMQRQPLPYELLNPYVKTLDASKIPPVKFQEIIRDGQATVVARMKIPTPNNHAFILRRLDTGAISSTTMFRASFPSATDEAERAEASWIKAHYNVGGANKQGTARFAGTWVTDEVALELARDYGLSPVIKPLTAAAPDPNVVFRKSGRAIQQPTPVASPVSTAVMETPPVKRRREGSPASTPSRNQLPVPTPRRPATPQRSAVGVATSRRSNRMASPAPTSTPASVAAVTQVITTTIEEEVTSHASDETAVEEDARELVTAVAPNMEEDIREQKELVNRLKAEAEAKAAAALEAARAVAGADSVADVELVVTAEVSTVTKRAREEEPTECTLNIKEPVEIGERAIVSNRRVRLGEMRPESKSLAWGALLFAAGVGAMSFIPSIPSFF